MPNTHLHLSSATKSLSTETSGAHFNAKLAGYALVDGLNYLKERLAWSGTKIAKVIHKPANVINTWLKNGTIPLSGPVLQPDIQAVVHLLAIHRSLEAMFEDSTHQQAWLTTLHPELNVIPENLMAESMEGLIFIRQYLDYVRGRGA